MKRVRKPNICLLNLFLRSSKEISWRINLAIFQKRLRRYVNLTFTDVISQMLTYVKFLNEILSGKKKVEETLVVKPNAQ